MTDVDRAAPLRFLETAYRAEDWIAVFLKSYETGQVAQRVGPVAAVAERRFQGWLRWLNLLRWNVYVSVNAMADNRRSRRRDAVAAVRHVFLEADHDGPDILAAINARRDLPPPSYVMQSSPGRVHVFWRVSGFGIEQVVALQKRLASELGTDPAATACTQTTRLPGFFNHKRQTPSLVTIEYHDSTRTYAPKDFPTAAATRVRRVFRERGRVAGRGSAVEQARRYLAAIPPAIAGQHGDLQTFRACCRLVRGFALTDEDALDVLGNWNGRCVPPWSERELLEKLQRARQYGREPVGGLLTDSTR